MTRLTVALLFSGFFSFFLTFYLVPILCKLAVKLNIVDVPDGNIKRHEKATPYLGGMAVYVGFIAGLSLVIPLQNQIFSLLIGSTLLLFVGLIDDVVVMKPYQKLFGQLLAVLCFLKGGLFLKEQFFQDFWFIGIPVSLLWILTITNGFNLIDVMDGLATTVALGAATSFFMFSLLVHQRVVALLLSAFLGALVGFLWHNRPPARIYLGDAGSLFIGGFLAAIPFFFSWSSYNEFGYLTPVIILAIPLLEVTVLVIVRTYKGIPFYKASPDHFSICLQRNGWSKKVILGYVTAISCILFFISYLFFFNYLTIVSLFLVGIPCLGLWIFLLLPKK